MWLTAMAVMMKGLRFLTLASLSLNLYRWYLIFVLFNLFYSFPNSSDDPIIARSRNVKVKHSWHSKVRAIWPKCCRTWYCVPNKKVITVNSLIKQWKIYVFNICDFPPKNSLPNSFPLYSHGHTAHISVTSYGHPTHFEWRVTDILHKTQW